MAFSTDIIIYILSGSSLVLAGVVIYLHQRLKKILCGKSGSDLESSLNTLIERVSDIEEFRRESEKYLSDLEQRVRRSSQAVETVRFNAFGGGGNGGNQSFATALLDEYGNGVVFSSIYSRERVSVFAKPIKKFTSEYELSEEENQAIAGAQSRLKSK
ncbi:MAG: DUF4446 domain-containing protein [Candidatus Taylorbacteria bacterium CG10_big_fil_rev_8_21_14_0_10_41_48]|uniref:DUF4446 domain-containing protein n=1 Tax=Candidatus Taylorbacteria bacterium CG10_big_fil_rev_8_21_14_0_10_41_48 TaxID=1975024 RepID=A0A2M8LBM3_9BACT|nr:MAG: DUF4446 domain-containing protein [Candidatus Taylorbacteria bacterium CG10_big_fil_rev_8_21_14_0_10_41_48]